MIKLRQLILIAMVFMMGCGATEAQRKADADAAAKAEADAAAAKEAARPKNAAAVLHTTENSVVTGLVSFAREGEQIRVNAEFQGLEPGVHTFHIHEVGDCSHPKAESAGAIYNPGGSTQFGNIEADEKGAAKVEFVDPNITIEGDNSIVKRAMVIQTGEGDAAVRLACGIIKLN